MVSETPTKSEGSAVNFDDANEAYTARYNHRLSYQPQILRKHAKIYMIVLVRVTLVRWLVQWHTKQVAAALNNAFTAGASAGGDGVALCDASHPLTSGGTFANEPSTALI